MSISNESQGQPNIELSTKQHFLNGLQEGIPVALGYFAVSFSLGILCRAVGFNPFTGFLFSMLNLTSAGEFAAVSLIGANAGYIEVAIVTLIANARYLLMSCALSQRMDENTSLLHRLAVAFGITDELFGIAINTPGKLIPVHYYGAVLIATLGWSMGTALGIAAGSALPTRLVSALSVALFGMFLAVIMPPARQNRVILTCVLVSFAASYVANAWEVLAVMSSGTRTIILTVVISAIAAILAPVKEEENSTSELDSLEEINLEVTAETVQQRTGKDGEQNG